MIFSDKGGKQSTPLLDYLRKKKDDRRAAIIVRYSLDEFLFSTILLMMYVLWYFVFRKILFVALSAFAYQGTFTPHLSQKLHVIFYRMEVPMTC